MIIRIPRFMVRAWDRFGDWSNVVIWESKSRGMYLSRIDLFIAGGFVFCVGYYWLVTAGPARCKALPSTSSSPCARCGSFDQTGSEAMKKAKKLKAKKQRKKNERVRGYLADINHHVGQLTMALRAVADKLDERQVLPSG